MKRVASHRTPSAAVRFLTSLDSKKKLRTGKPVYEPFVCFLYLVRQGVSKHSASQSILHMSKVSCVAAREQAPLLVAVKYLRQ